MSTRRALIIGASEYGEGFAPLPAVATDLELVDRALSACGYEVAALPRSATESATTLINAIETFCARCQRDDVHVIYFSGHGMLLGNEDCIIPAGAALDRVVRRGDLRVPTDLSASLPADHGLIVFFVDACRSPEHQPTTKSASAWGDNDRIRAPADRQFVRFFGCSSGEVCQVLPTGHEGRPVSVFSKALTDVLAAGQATTLKECLTQIQEQCRQLAASAHLELQTPRLSLGETSADTEQLLGAPIFRADAGRPVPVLWETFDPDKLHCLIIASEYETKAPSSWTLDDLAAAALTETGPSAAAQEQEPADPNPRIWDAFRACCHGAELASGRTRSVSARFDPALVRQVTLPINVALASRASLREAVRGIVEADVVIFDVTGFEPGVMMLVGVRAACRRGVTLCSHGNRWREGQPLDLPFNLQDLNVGSHTPREPGAGANPVVRRVVDRVVAGFEQLQHRPHYLDLPAYDALRQLGSDIAASALVPTSRRVLVLCPYEKNFFANWELLISRLTTSLSNGHNIRPQILRVIDLATPQLVSQSIYEQARLTAGCVADWSSYSPSVFVEFGVREAVSDWGAVCIVDRRFAQASDDALARTRAELVQVEQLQTLFEPIEYSMQSQQKAADFGQMASALANKNPRLGANQGLSIIHDAAWRAVESVQAVLPTVYAELRAGADALSHADRGEVEAPQILFYESSALKANSEDAATERRIAAWLYLHKREHAAALPESDPRKRAYYELGRAAAAALYAQSERGRAESLDLAMYIEEKMKQAMSAGEATKAGEG
jgi:hypothetical protein